MSTETQVAPGEATQINAPEVVETLEVTTPEVEGQEPQDEAKEGADKPQLTEAEKEAKALRRRIDRMTRDRYQRDAETDQLRRENDQLRTRPAEQPDQDTRQGLTQADIEALVERRAQEKVTAQSTIQKTEVVNNKLKKALGEGLDDFYGDIQAAGASGVSLVRSAIELDSAADVLTFLGKNPDEMDKVLEMSPIKQAAYMGRLEARIEAEKKTPERSNAPKPLTPVKGSSTSNAPDINDTAKWIKWSNEQDALKRNKR